MYVKTVYDCNDIIFLYIKIPTRQEFNFKINKTLSE